MKRAVRGSPTISARQTLPCRTRTRAMRRTQRPLRRTSSRRRQPQIPSAPFRDGSPTGRDFSPPTESPGTYIPTANQIDLAARGTAWGEAVGVALDNSLGPLKGQVVNFLDDAAQGTAIYSAPLSSQPNHAPFQGAVVASSVQVTGVATNIDMSL